MSGANPPSSAAAASNQRLVGRLSLDGTVLSWGHVNDSTADQIIAAKGLVVMTPAQIAQMESGTVLRYAQGAFVVVAPPAPDIGAVAAKALAAIDAAADQARLSVLSYGSTMAYVYTLKLSEASQALVDPNPQLASYPLLAGDVGLTGPTILAVAQAVVSRAGQVAAWLGRVEAVRLGAKAQVKAAATCDAIAAALKGIVWPALP